MNLENIGANLKSIRVKKGITQSRLAEKANISTVHMSHIETGSVSMSLDSLLSISCALGVTPDNILFGEYELSSNSTLAIIDKYIEKMSDDEKKLLIEFAKLLTEMNINKK